MRMIEEQRKQCLEDAQLENATAGEAPPGGKTGTPPRSPATHVVRPHPGRVHCTSSERDRTQELLGAEERVLGGAGEPDGRRKALTDLHVPI